MPKIYLVTGNRHKVAEFAGVLEPLGVRVEPIGLEKLEIQSDSIVEVARYAASRLPVMDAPVAVEDAGLFVEPLRGFPGPYSSYVYKTIGVEGVLRLLDGVDERDAYFLSAIGVKDTGGHVRVFTGRVDGRIALEPRGRGGFGFDPIFIPEGWRKTFAEASMEEKNRVSHRARAARALAEWLLDTTSGEKV